MNKEAQERLDAIDSNIKSLQEEADKLRKLTEEKPKYPTSIDEVRGRYWYIGSIGDILKLNILNTDCINDPNNLSSQERAEQFLEMMQLIELRDAWNKVDGFVADWADINQDKWIISCGHSSIYTHQVNYLIRALYFGSKETAELFLKTFRDKIEKAKELL